MSVVRVDFDTTRLDITADAGNLITLFPEDVSFDSVKRYVSDGGRDIDTITFIMREREHAHAMRLSSLADLMEAK